MSCLSIKLVTIQHLILVARDRQKLAEVAAEITSRSVKVTTLSLDLTQVSSIDIAIAQAWRTHRPIHLLINCAGVAHQAPFLETQLPKVHEEISVNLLGMITVTLAVEISVEDAFLPLKRGGLKQQML